jgi:hypothetical protein
VGKRAGGANNNPGQAGKIAGSGTLAPNVLSIIHQIGVAGVTTHRAIAVALNVQYPHGARWCVA